MKTNQMEKSKALYFYITIFYCAANKSSAGT
jgi:hypothetical protein